MSRKCARSVPEYRHSNFGLTNDSRLDEVHEHKLLEEHTIATNGSNYRKSKTICEFQTQAFEDHEIKPINLYQTTSKRAEVSVSPVFEGANDEAFYTERQSKNDKVNDRILFIKGFVVKNKSKTKDVFISILLLYQYGEDINKVQIPCYEKDGKLHTALKDGGTLITQTARAKKMEQSDGTLINQFIPAGYEIRRGFEVETEKKKIGANPKKVQLLIIASLESHGTWLVKKLMKIARENNKNNKIENTKTLLKEMEKKASPLNSNFAFLRPEKQYTYKSKICGTLKLFLLKFEFKDVWKNQADFEQKIDSCLKLLRQDKHLKKELKQVGQSTILFPPMYSYHNERPDQKCSTAADCFANLSGKIKESPKGSEVFVLVPLQNQKREGSFKCKSTPAKKNELWELQKTRIEANFQNVFNGAKLIDCSRLTDKQKKDLKEEWIKTVQQILHEYAEEYADGRAQSSKATELIYLSKVGKGICKMFEKKENTKKESRARKSESNLIERFLTPETARDDVMNTEDELNPAVSSLFDGVNFGEHLRIFDSIPLSEPSNLNEPPEQFDEPLEFPLYLPHSDDFVSSPNYSKSPYGSSLEDGFDDPFPPWHMASGMTISNDTNQTSPGENANSPSNCSRKRRRNETTEESDEHLPGSESESYESENERSSKRRRRISPRLKTVQDVVQDPRFVFQLQQNIGQCFSPKIKRSRDFSPRVISQKSHDSEGDFTDFLVPDVCVPDVCK